MKKLKFVTLGVAIFIVLLFGMQSCNEKQKLSEEKMLIEEIQEDQDELSDLYERSDFMTSQWLEEYRKVGIRFIQYLCEYGGKEEEVLKLMAQYEQYGQAILKIAELLEEEKLDEAKTKLIDLKIIAQKAEEQMEKCYGQYY